MKFFIVLIALVAVASAGYIGHHQETYFAPFVNGAGHQPLVPGPHPKPISYKGNEHTTRIHYSGGHVGHPHLVGVEHYVGVPEPGIAVVKAGGHGW
ncbi:hypothetical protein P5V15_014587 [Pogonomyrmex californicus]